MFLDILEEEARALLGFRDRFATEQLGAVVSLLAECTGKVALVGVGKSGMIARKIAGTFSSTGTPAFFLHPVEAMHGDLGVLSSRDVVFAVTKGGESEELVRMLRAAQEMKLPIVAIVGRADSSTGRLADAYIETGIEAEAGPFGLAPTTSALLAMAVADALAMVVAQARGFTPERFAGFHPGGQLGRRLNYTVRDLLPPDRGVPIVAPDSNMQALIEEENRLNLGGVLIADANRRLVGIVTDGDIRRSILRFGNILERPIQDVMTSAPVTVRLDSPATEALALMENRPSQIYVLPVLDAQDRIAGLLRLHDVVRAGL